jgi:surface polysaccharide O-acyltransferase-like enzyme
MLDLVNRSHKDPEGRNSQKSLRWILVDSVIIGMIAMCAAMPSTIPTAADLWVMFKAFLGSFVLQLAVERGLKRKEGDEG